MKVNGEEKMLSGGQEGGDPEVITDDHTPEPEARPLRSGGRSGGVFGRRPHCQPLDLHCAGNLWTATSFGVLRIWS